ncbi:MAG: hypothetical protein ABIG42_09720 [bacterium]
MTNYASEEEVRKRDLPLPSPTSQEVSFALQVSKDIIDMWCGQVFLKTAGIEFIVDGNGGNRYVFGQRLNDVFNLYVNDSEIPSASIINFSDHNIGEIGLKDGYQFTRGSMNVKLVAEIGYAETPFAVREASAHLAALILTRQLFSGKPSVFDTKSERLLDYSKSSLVPSEINGIIESDVYLYGLLRPYRVVGVGV